MSTHSCWTHPCPICEQDLTPDQIAGFIGEEKESDPKALTDKAMKAKMPVFVDGDKPDDHKCGNCVFRVPGNGDVGECTIMKGKISMANGTCTFWSHGEASTKDKIADQQMDYELAGYVEVPKGMKVQCGTCKFGNKDNFCKLWNGTYKNGQCCMTWDNDKAKTPPQS